MKTLAIQALLDRAADKSGVTEALYWRITRWSGNANPQVRFRDGSYMALTRNTANMARVGQSVDGATWNGSSWIPDTH